MTMTTSSVSRKPPQFPRSWLPIKQSRSGAAVGIDGAQSPSIARLSPVLAELGLINRKTDIALAGLVTLRNLPAHGPAT